MKLEACDAIRTSIFSARSKVPGGRNFDFPGSPFWSGTAPVGRPAGGKPAALNLPGTLGPFAVQTNIEGRD